MNSGNILVVDDDADAVEALAESLRARGFRATPETNPNEAIADAIGDKYDVVVTDLQMRSLDGLALCERIVGARPDLPVVVVTGHASVDAAVGALRAGAYDFIVKPVDPEILALTVERAVQHHLLRSEVQRLRIAVAADTDPSPRLLGKSPAMRKVLDVVSRIAPTQATVLITGESGTGKELIARAIHENSPRRDGPFIAINCAAVPASLLESELFGHAKGAFTDAKNSRRGLFLEAQGGTLFLDEIGEMPLEMQVKLLRALQERVVRAVGGTGDTAFDARVVAATNKDLEREVLEKRFREDLYYRVNVCSVEAPPLRERAGDVPLLARAFVDRFANKHEKAVKGIAAAALAKLVQYDWPGNVRELENGIERAVAMAQYDQLVIEDLPERVRAYRPEQGDMLSPTTVSELVSLDDFERRYISHVIGLVKGNKSRAARILGLDRRTLYRKLERQQAAVEGTESRDSDGRPGSAPPSSAQSVMIGSAARRRDQDSSESTYDLKAEALPDADDEPRDDERGSRRSVESGVHVAPTEARSSASLASEIARNGSHSVLVVDDDLDTLEQIQILLQAKGYRVEVASGVAEAMRTRNVDIVLTDLHLQDGSGAHLLGRFGDAPVVAMTGSKESNHHGFQGWLTKPVSLERLTSTLANLLEASVAAHASTVTEIVV